MSDSMASPPGYSTVPGLALAAFLQDVDEYWQTMGTVHDPCDCAKCMYEATKLAGAALDFAAACDVERPRGAEAGDP